MGPSFVLLDLCVPTGSDSFHTLTTTMDRICPDLWKSQYTRHNAAVRSLVPADQLLEYNVKQGWGPLCRFLGLPEPDEPFPHENKLGKAGNIIDKYAKFTILKRARDEAWAARSVGLAGLVALVAGLLQAVGWIDIWQLF